MIVEIDLHGFSHSEALNEVENKLLILSNIDKFFTCNVITGNSKKLQQLIINKVLDKYSFKYLIPYWNSGMIVVNGN
jgi:DNA-nicking Smr family endonuclease